MEDKAAALLDLLPAKSIQTFQLFLDSLREDYDWLADELEKALDDPNTLGDDNVDHAELVRQRIDLLQLSACRRPS